MSKTDIRFYHLERSALESALPALVGKAYESGKNIVIRTETASQREDINTLLWTYRDDSFLPHGSEKDGNPEHQPIWITEKDENPSSAEILILTHGAEQEDFAGFDLICDMFDGRDETALQKARARWSACKERAETSGSLTYWQQTDQGWEKKAEG